MGEDKKLIRSFTIEKSDAGSLDVKSQEEDDNPVRSEVSFKGKEDIFAAQK